MIKSQELFWALINVLKIMVKDWRQVKYGKRWLKAWRYRQRPLDYGQPWLSFEAIDWLEKYLNKKMRVFEWGAGGSTLWLGQRVKELVSIEHDPKWWGQVKRKLKELGLDKKVKVKLRVGKKVKGQTGEYGSGAVGYKGVSFEDYCRESNKEKGEFDLILVDGRARVGCVKEAMERVKPGGWLMVDNADVDRYKRGLERLKIWPRRDYRSLGSFNSWEGLTSAWRRG